ncbi:MAG: ASKHA domain-containing protein [Bacteroides fragilis]|nr:ASKHA domain-containing protein [Bacteroides fragilis]
MSETIQMTFITENEKQERQEIRVTHDSDVTLMTTLLKKKLISGNFCGGKGTCGRCRVRFMQAAPVPTGLERQVFAPDELRLGYRLACMARPKNDCAVQSAFVQPRPIEILTDLSDVIAASEKDDHISQKEKTEKRYLIAVDLGTTTIAMRLMDIDSGRAADTCCALNPQRSYGADVLSRIQAANAGQAEALRESVWEVLMEGVGRFRRFCRAAGQETSICCMCVAGNTTMEHLLMGLSTEGLGKSPFAPEKLGLQKCVLPDGAMPVYVTPGISAFVGGDIVAGLYTLKMLPLFSGNIPQGTAVLFIDLGTNGELALTDGKRMLVTAAAAGPAFEGGSGRAVAGSDMIALAASLLKEGVIDESGLMAGPYFEEGITLPLPGEAKGNDSADASVSAASIRLTQKDIRDLQMAKAAVRAGVDILCRKMGFPEISQVCLAGGFGYYLDVDAAAAIGLLPESLKSCTKAVGNTALAGAFHMGKDLWTGKLREGMLDEMLQGIESINLAEQEEFAELYIRYMNLESS